MEDQEFDIDKKLSYKPSELRIKIYLFLERKNLLAPVKGTIKWIRKVREFLGVPSTYVSPEEMEELKREKNFINDFEEFISRIQKIRTSGIFSTVIFSGYVSSYIKGGNRFLQELFDRLPEFELIALSQSGKSVTEHEEDKIAFDVWTVPRVPFLGGYDIGLKIHLTEEMKNAIDSKKYLQDAVYNIKSYHDDFGEGYAEALVYYTYRYAEILIETYKPVCFIVHNKLYSMQDVIVNVCIERNVKPLYFEFGALPGTFALEDKGQMGASFVSVDYEKFRNLPVTSDELKKAAEIWRYLKNTGLNRNTQTTQGIEGLNLKKDRPILLFAGQNDYDSGICPYTEYSKKNHSPIFATSDDAVRFLAEIAKKNEWNLIYKPHPLAVKHHRCLAEGLPDNVIWISDVDINKIIDISDVVITILSQVGDIALIREKPTVMLGYTQLRGKGCAYEAYKSELIESNIKKALEEGFTDRKQQAFIRHIAQTVKYYLYDDLNEREMRFGRKIDECSDYIRKKVTKDERSESNRSLFICKNCYEITLAYRIKEIIPGNAVIDILTNQATLQYFGAEHIKECLGNITDLVHAEKNKYDYLFFTDIHDAGSDLFHVIESESPNIKKYIYDAGEIYSYTTDYFKIPEEDKCNICGVITLQPELNVCKYKKWNYHNIGSIQDCHLTRHLDNRFSYIKEKYIYLESHYFRKRITTNEIDLLDEIAEKVGKENIVVKLETDESFLRFSMRGYKIILMSDDEWFAFCLSDNAKRHCLIGIYPEFAGYILSTKSSFLEELYLYKILVTQDDFIKSVGFLRFMDIYQRCRAKNKSNIFAPDKNIELDIILDYIEEMNQ